MDTPIEALLVTAGALSAEQLEQAIAEQRRQGGTLVAQLARLAKLSEDQLADFLAKQLKLARADLRQRSIPVSLQRLVPLETVRASRLLPLAQEARRLLVGMVDPTDGPAIEELTLKCGRAVRVAVLSGRQLDEALEVFRREGYGVKPLALGKARAIEAPPGPTLTALLTELVSQKGQDLHLSAGAPPSLRLDGEMQRLGTARLAAAEIEALVLPLLSVEQRRSFEGRWELDFAHEAPGLGRFRCNLFRQRGTLAFTARHVQEHIPTLAQLGLPPLVRELVLQPHGLVLVTGPYGHGRSTTLASLIDAVNRSRRANIVTVEEPVEYLHRHQLSNVNQREVGTDTRSFEEGLRQIFRQNPDVIVIGELRDRESFGAALGAAATGHLVLATLHALSTTAALDRVLEMFAGEEQGRRRAQLADVLLLVLNQRLLRRCDGHGRALAWESLTSSARVRHALREGRAHALRAMMQSNLDELHSIDKSLADLVGRALVTREEAVKFADDPGYFEGLCVAAEEVGRR